ncbi:MAG TPA: tripartite tricarboxylate transporter substrate-binding protein [Burkholderiales bacterium]|jgi:tripartite-type tricarboxylate transporter receptor subunit TctC|nr:tripartite tricarboxylate transporter substrate-binding protein [Burkholderiales bacterium]
MKKLLAALLLAPGLALAQGYPAKPARIIVPFPPGGTTDLIARMVQAKFQEHLGTQILIENKGGAGGSIGAADAARSAPDGYTMLMVFDTHAVNHHLYKSAPDPFTALEHLMLMVTSPSSLVAGTAFTPGNLKEVVAAAKAQPEKVSYGSVGSGSSNHLGALLLEQVAGIRMLHVPYKGGGPLVQAMLGNQVNVAFISTPLILPHIKSGKVKAIAVGGKQRMAVLPEVATLSETFPGFEQVSWFGLLVPAGTPKDVSAKIHGAMAKTLAVPEVRQKLIDGGFEMVASSPEEFLRFVRAESDKLGKLIRDNGIKVE